MCVHLVLIKQVGHHEDLWTKPLRIGDPHVRPHAQSPGLIVRARYLQMFGKDSRKGDPIGSHWLGWDFKGSIGISVESMIILCMSINVSTLMIGRKSMTCSDKCNLVSYFS